MRYLITGGSGYIGTRLVDLLARREDTEKIVIADGRELGDVTTLRDPAIMDELKQKVAERADSED